MGIKPDSHYPRQMNGPVISAFGAARDQQLEAATAIEDYLHGLTIDTANETELENIGRIIGYVRPLVPRGFTSENLLLLGTVPLTQDEQIGLAEAGSEIGGQLSTLAKSDTYYMGLGTYRKFLKSMAILKRYGITLQSIDKVVSIVSTDYTISHDSNHDVVVHFNSNIGYKNVWILTQLFYKVATIPQVLITTGGN